MTASRGTPERRRSQFFPSFSLSPGLSKKPFSTPLSPSGTSRTARSPLDLASTIQALDPAKGIELIARHVNLICAYVQEYDLSLSDGLEVYAKSKVLLQTNDSDINDLGFQLLQHLLKYQKVPQEFRLDVFEYLRTISKTLDKLRRPFLLYELLEGGANIDGLEHIVLHDLTIVVADCYAIKRSYQAESSTETEHGVNFNACQHSLHQSLLLLASVIKFGPALGTSHSSNTITEISRFVDTIPPPSEDEVFDLLGIYNALLLRAEVPRDSLYAIVRSLCRLQGQSSRSRRTNTVTRVQQTFQWLFNTHLQNPTVSTLVQIAKFEYKDVDVETQQADGAIQLLTFILADPRYASQLNVDIKDLLTGWHAGDVKRASLSSKLGIVDLLVKVEHLQQRLVSELDWGCVFIAISRLSERIETVPDQDAKEARAFLYDILHCLDTVPGINAGQRYTLDSLYLELAPHLPEDLADKLLRTYERPLEASVCAREMRAIKRGFLDSPGVPSQLRLHAADILQAACLEAHQRDPSQGRLIADLILDGLSTQGADMVLQARLVEHSLEYEAQSVETDAGFWDEMVYRMAKAAQRNAAPEPAASTSIRGSSTRHITSALVTLFMRSVNISADRAQRLYSIFLELLKSPSLDPAATVMILRGFFRMRSDVDHHIFLIPSPEGEGLAANLCRSSDVVPKGSRRQSRTSTLSESGPVWMYGEIRGLTEDPSDMVSPLLFSQPMQEATMGSTLDLQSWLQQVIRILEHGADWEIYSYVIVHLGAQLTNQSLFTYAVAQIRELRSLVCSLILKQSFQKPPEVTDLKQADVAVCLYHILTMLIGYHEHFSKLETEEMISTFIMGMTAWDRTTVHCVHALTLCCYELPEVLKRNLARIIDQMSTIVTKSNAAVHVLEFLVGLARLKDLAKTFHGEEIKTVFGVCLSYIDYVRGKRFDDAQQQRRPTPLGRVNASAASSELAINRATTLDMPQYVFALAYNVLTFWYITLRESDREKYFPWMQRRLLSTDQAGNQEEQALTTLDLIWRITKRNVNSTSLMRPEPPASGASAWTSYFALLTVSIDLENKVANIVERRASGTDVSSIPIEEHCTPEAIFDKHIMCLTDRPFPNGWDPSPLIDSDAAKRAVSMLDRVSPVDFYKAGVVYIGEDQTAEGEILANLMGSGDYRLMLQGLGTTRSLLGLQYNTCGLDTSEAQTDGKKTLWYRDEVTALIYHVSTMMPTNLKYDPQCTRKKAHIGNDYVNIFFNNSGTAFDYATLNDLIPSAFNYVYIVVAPEARATFIETRTRQHQDGWFEKSWFKIQVLTRPDFPNISSAAETKVVSGGVLAAYVRNLTLNACIFANVWANRDGGDTPSSWRARLMQLRMLKERFGKRDEEGTKAEENR